MEKVRRTPASVKKLAEYFHMEILCKGGDYDTCVITVSDVFRPSLQLVGFYDYFDTKRLLILGKSEMRFLSRMTTEEDAGLQPPDELQLSRYDYLPESGGVRRVAGDGPEAWPHPAAHRQ